MDRVKWNGILKWNEMKWSIIESNDSDKDVDVDDDE